MAIKLVCPNGHVLKVPDKLAGKSGLCPVCRARVVVPQPGPDALSEDAILGILGSHTPREATQITSEQLRAARAAAGTDGEVAKKICRKCNREIPASMHICPFCHTYIAGLHDFRG